MSRNSEKIRELNDEFRKNIPVPFGGGKVTLTQGVLAKFNALEISQLMKTIRNLEDKFFTEDNDPFGEHDFGVVTQTGTRVYWKIDYYDWTFTYGAEDPANEETTRRVMTILLPEEY